MHIATIRDDGRESPVVVDPARGALRPQVLDPGFDGDALALLARDMQSGLLRAAASVASDRFERLEGLTFTAPYRSPRKIWGIGLNYRDHAGDLDKGCRRSRRPSSRATTRSSATATRSCCRGRALG